MNGRGEHAALAASAVTTRPEPPAARREGLRVAARWAAVARLLPGVAHDLMTPLSVIGGRARLIAAGALDESRVRSGAKTIGEQAARLGDILEPLLALAGEDPPDPGPEDAGAALERVIRVLQPLAHAHGVTVERPGGVGGSWTCAAGTPIRRILVGVLIRAIHVTPRGRSVMAEVCRRGSLPPGRTEGDAVDSVVVQVSDGGPDVRPEALPGLLEPFGSGRAADADVGLGLAIAHELACEHGGWIGLRSAAGRGCRVDVVLPPAPT